MAKSAKINWHGPRVTREIRAGMRERLLAAGEALAEKVQENIDVQGPPASLPDEFPHKETGELQDSIHVRLDARSLSVDVVADAEHAPFVEEIRPFLRRTMREMKPVLRRIILADKGRGKFKFAEK